MLATAAIPKQPKVAGIALFLMGISFYVKWIRGLLPVGLDAHVSCNCYELGKLREAPPVPLDYIRVDSPGYLIYALDDDPEWEAVKHLPWTDVVKNEVFEKQIQFDTWEWERACEHERMILLHHRLGNLWLVVGLRSELQREASRYPILLEKVLYSFSHSGDWLPLETVEQLQPELEALKDFPCEDPEMIPFMPRFQQQMVELVEAALSVGKPIWF